MMTDMRKSIIYIVAAAFAFASCDDLLTLVPESQITPESYFKTEEDLRLFSNTFYNNLLDKECYARESDLFVSMDPSALIRGGNDRKVPDTGGGWSWGNLRKMNTLLANIDNCSDEAAVKKYTALTKFWRAYFYFDKIQKFGDVPWIEKELGSADEDVYAARDTRETVLQNMIKDIDEAIENLGEPAAKPEKVFRVNRYTAMFLKAQFCLFEGTFRKYHTSPLPFENSYKAKDGSTHDYKWYLQQSYETAKMLMDSKKYSIYKTGNPNSDYLNMFTALDANTFDSEMILAINFDKIVGISHDATKEFTMQPLARYGMTKKLVDMYLMKDGKRFTDKPGWNILGFADEVKDRDPRLAQTIRTSSYSWKQGVHEGPELKFCQTGYQSIKYVLPYETGSFNASTSYNDLPVYRYAELLLNYAEAKAEYGEISQEDIDASINLIRARVGMPNLTLAGLVSDPYLLSDQTGYPNVKGDPQEAVILEIRRERAIELFQEGYGRYFDLMRWKAGYCLNQPMHGMYIPGPGNYSFGDNSDYTFYVESTESKKTLYKIYDPSGAEESDMVYLWDPNTQKYATSGNIDPLKKIPHSFDESKHYLYPIAKKELELNKNLDQNPNWVN